MIYEVIVYEEMLCEVILYEAIVFLKNDQMNDVFV